MGNGGGVDLKAGSAMVPTRYNDVAARLSANGWTPIPCLGKKPAIEKWTAYNHTSLTVVDVVSLSNEFADAGVGQPGRPGTIIVDADVKQPDRAARVRDLTFEIFGRTPLVRLGDQPKAAYFYRGNLRGKVSHRGATRYVSGAGREKVEGVEVFGSSGLVMLFGWNPDAQRDYEWSERSPLDMRVDDPAIPLIADPVQAVEHLLSETAKVIGAHERQVERPRQLETISPASDWVASALAGEAEGARNDTAFRLSCYLFRSLPEDLAAEVVRGFGARCSPAMDHEELERTIESARTLVPESERVGLPTPAWVRVALWKDSAGSADEIEGTCVGWYLARRVPPDIASAVMEYECVRSGVAAAGRRTLDLARDLRQRLGEERRSALDVVGVIADQLRRASIGEIPQVVASTIWALVWRGVSGEDIFRFVRELVSCPAEVCVDDLLARLEVEEEVKAAHGKWMRSNGGAL